MIVTEFQVVQAMQFFENKHIAAHGPLDKISLPREMSQLADLLGAMWFAKEQEAEVSDASKIGTLLREALALPAADGAGTAGPAPASAASLQPPNEQPLFAPEGRDEGDVTCEACQ